MQADKAMGLCSRAKPEQVLKRPLNTEAAPGDIRKPVEIKSRHASFGD